MKINSIVKVMLFCFAAALMFSCSKESLNANGNQITQIRQTEPFKTVNVAGSSPVFITFGSSFKVELKGSDNLIAKFITKVEANELILKHSNMNVSTDDIRIYITMPALAGIEANGSSTYEISGDFPDEQTFRVNTNGAGKVAFLGTLKTQRLNAEIKGSGNMDLERVLAADAEIKISGSGNVITSVSEKLDARISGSGNVFYLGLPELMVYYIGSGRVIKK